MGEVPCLLAGGAQRASTLSLRVAEAEAALVHRLHQGDGAAQEELYRRFGPDLHRFAASRLSGEQESAEEVMVETLGDALRNIGRFDPGRASLAAWLRGIARHRVQREQRRRRRRKSVPICAQVPLEAVQEKASEPDLASRLTEHLLACQQVAHLAAILSGLELEVLVLRSVRGLSVHEIGRIVGRSERAVAGLLHRARQKAREALVGHAG